MQIREAGVYVRDSYDFNGSQALGWWRKPGWVSLFSPRSEKSKRLERYRCPDEWFPMADYSFRAYRKRSGFGGDFIIYSTVKVVSIEEIEWSYKRPE